MLEKEHWSQLFSDKSEIFKQLNKKARCPISHIEETFDKVLLAIVERGTELSFTSYEHFKNYVKRAVLNNLYNDFKRDILQASVELQENRHPNYKPFEESDTREEQDIASFSQYIVGVEQLLINIPNGKIRHRCALILACISQNPEKYIKKRQGIYTFDANAISKRIRKPKMSTKTIKRYLHRIKELLSTSI